MSTSANLAASQNGVAPRQRSDRAIPVCLAPLLAALGQTRIRIGPAGAQRLDELQVAAHDGRVQRRVPRAPVVGVGAPVEKQCGGPALAAEAGHHQRRLAGGRRFVDVRAGVEQQPDILEPPVARGEKQGRIAALRHHDRSPADVVQGISKTDGEQVGGRPRVNVGAVRQQQPDDFRLVPGRRAHEGGLPVGRLPGVHVGGAAAEERRHRIDRTGPHARHQQRLAHRGRRVRVRTRRQEPREHGFVAVEAGQRSGSDAVIVGGGHVRAGAQERLGHRGIVPLDRPVQRRGAVPLAGVDGDALAEQRAYRFVVPGLDGLDEFQVGARSRDAPGGEADSHHLSRGVQKSAHALPYGPLSPAAGQTTRGARARGSPARCRRRLPPERPASRAS